LLPALVTLGGQSIPRLRGLSLDWRVMAVAALLASGSAMAFGLLPALRASRTQPANAMRERAGAAAGGSVGRMRAALVVAQVAVAFVLLIGAGLMLASISELQRLDLGVASRKVLTFELNLPAIRYDSVARARFYEDIARSVEGIPGV